MDDLDFFDVEEFVEDNLGTCPFAGVAYDTTDDFKQQQFFLRRTHEETNYSQDYFRFD